MNIISVISPLIILQGVILILSGTILFAEYRFPLNHPNYNPTRLWQHLGLGVMNLSISLGGFWMYSAGLDAVRPNNSFITTLYHDFPVLTLFLGIIVLDLFMYVIHRSYHANRALWRFHRVHHTDVELTSSTVFRFHIGEILISTALRLFVFSLSGIPADIWLYYDLIAFPVILFHHANLLLPPKIDRVIRLMLVTPIMHQFHHSKAEAHAQCNYSSILSLWDRLFGTLLIDENASLPLPYGIALENKSSDTFVDLLLSPFRNYSVEQRPQ